MNQEPDSIKGCIHKLISDKTGVILGRVTQVSPLRIVGVNDDKLILNRNTVIVPRHLTNYTTTCNISGGAVNSQTISGGEHLHDGGAHGGHNGGDGSHVHSGGEHLHLLANFNLVGAAITINNALRVGDVVHMLSFNKGKKYYIFDRE